MKKILAVVWPLIVIIVASFFTWQPLLHSGFFTFHDEQQIGRLFQLDKALMSGQFPVRWVPDLGFGFGYPLFNFYPPLVYYLGEIFHLAGASFVAATKLVWFTALVGSTLTMYFLGRHLFGKLGAVVSSLFYLYAPYHAVDAYVRGALAELFSFVWLPLILLAIIQKRSVVAGVFLALLMLTHNLIFLPFLGFFAVWALFYDRKSIIISPLVAFGLTAFFWLPSLLEKQYTLVDDLLIKNLASYKIHFVCLPQLWDSAWGYGGSVAGCVDGLSLKIGKPHIIVAVLSLLLVAIKKTKIAVATIVLFFVSVFMTTEYSKPVWDIFPPLWYLQFPWRFLEFATLFSSLLAGSIIFVAPKKLKVLFTIALIGVVLAVGIKYFQPQTYLNVSDSDLTSDQEIKWKVSSTSFEYLPKGFDAKSVTLDQAMAPLPTIPYVTDFSTPSIVTFGIANFPGWQVWIDGEKTAIMDDNPYKLIMVNVPAGHHTITGKFTDTPIRVAGNLVSSFSLILLCAYGYFRYKKSHH